MNGKRVTYEKHVNNTSMGQLEQQIFLNTRVVLHWAWHIRVIVRERAIQVRVRVAVARTTFRWGFLDVQTGL